MSEVNEVDYESLYDAAQDKVWALGRTIEERDKVIAGLRTIIGQACSVIGCDESSLVKSVVEVAGASTATSLGWSHLFVNVDGVMIAVHGQPEAIDHIKCRLGAVDVVAP